jgi:hypothetical protein
MTTAEMSIAPLVKSATVPQDPAGAFRIFTERIAEWWPLETHSVGAADAVGLTFGRAVGERIIETIRGGETSSWGVITAWEPPDRVAFSWHPGTPPDEATAVEVTFVAGSDGTRVTLTHTGWENRPDGHRFRTNYDAGWDIVFGRYATLAAG